MPAPRLHRARPSGAETKAIGHPQEMTARCAHCLSIDVSNKVQICRTLHTCHWLDPCGSVCQLHPDLLNSTISKKNGIRRSSDVAENTHGRFFQQDVRVRINTPSCQEEPQGCQALFSIRPFTAFSV